MPKQNEPTPRAKHRSLPIAEITLLTITFASLVFGGYFFYKYQNVNDKYKEVTLTSEDKIKRAVSQVAELYNVPKYEDEQPSVPGVEGSGIYTVQEAELENLKKNNSFFTDAKAGDTLVAYKNANISILYRPSEKKIIKLGSYAESALVKVGVGIVASSDTAKNIETTIYQKFPNQVTITIKSPSTNTVAKGVVVDITGKEPAAAKQIADALGYDVGELPPGELATEGASLVVIAPNVPTQ